MPSSETVEDIFSRVSDLAGKGEAEAQLALGQMLLNGIGVERDEAAALRWFLASAMQGVSMACNMVGRCCELGWGISPSLSDAMLWYQRAARAGLDWGMYNYATGLTLGWDGVVDHAEALMWLRRAAALGHCKSFNIIGGFYEDGWSVACDLKRARAYYAQAARCGDFRGHFNFGRFLRQEGRVAEAEWHFGEARRLGNARFVVKMDAFLAGGADLGRA